MMNSVGATLTNDTLPPAATAQVDPETTLSESEKKFLKRIAGKYGNSKRKPLLQSLLIFTAMIVIGHCIERTSLPWWAAFALVYAPALFLFSRYRRFSIFKSKLMRKLALREELHERQKQEAAA